jgi:tRNA(Arg) A34 adenosine deaminase TadA
VGALSPFLAHDVRRGTIMTGPFPDEMVLRLPAWTGDFVTGYGAIGSGDKDRMRFTIELARENVKRGTGGPFGAAVFDEREGTLVAVGVNTVVPARCSVAHAEIKALALAQQRLGTHDLSAGNRGPCVLYSTAEPCAMCTGAIPWSGIRRLVCAARAEDVCRTGFDEGAKPGDWLSQMERRGISVVTDVCRREATDVLTAYQASGGPIYNPARPDP